MTIMTTKTSEGVAALTPMMAQYHQIKAEYKDFILFFRLGDFYEMFFEDAIKASEALEITLTKRNAGGGEQAPLCGVPYHAADAYIAKLVNAGFKVAICEQMEDPALAKGIVRREVVRIVTPGTVIDPSMLEEKRNNFMIALVEVVEHGQVHYGLAYGDVTTGLLRTTAFKQTQKQALIDELIRLQPSEIVLTEDTALALAILATSDRIGAALTYKDQRFFAPGSCEGIIKRVYGVQSLEGLGLYQAQPQVMATGGLLAYLEETQKSELSHFKRLDPYAFGQHMIIDHFTRVNLELTQTMRQKDKRGSLLWVLDKTKTAMGGRLLKRWLEEPLLDLEAIHQRLDVVKFLYDELIIREDIRAALDQVYDLERLLTKAVFGSLNGRDALALRDSLKVLPTLAHVLTNHGDPAMDRMMASFDSLEDLFSKLEGALKDEQPFSIREGNIFKLGYCEDLDELRDIIANGKAWLLEIEESERQRTGIKNLKIGFNKVFGYYVEISKGSVKMAPEDYIRKQTLANCERYMLPKLKEIEDKILGAEERINKLEYELFADLRLEIVKGGDRIRQMADLLARLDVLASFAEVSARNHYIPPLLDDGDLIDIADGRHPVVERIGTDEGFVPNDAMLDGGAQQIYIVTGPNMAGKSTYLRQVALIVLMAQVGCFVPASRARIGLVDRVFTRVGASDDLFSGQSTFMVEMNELANILNHATQKSLIILDEIGRGTATYDGLSLAWSTVEHLSHSLGAKSIFATHYHELTELEGKVKGVRNFRIAVREEGEHIAFLRKIERGGASQSFGIQVARLAGVPQGVIERAKEILSALEASDIANRPEASGSPSKVVVPEALEALLFELEGLDPNLMTPITAMLQLSALVEKAKGIKDRLRGQDYGKG